MKTVSYLMLGVLIFVFGFVLGMMSEQNRVNKPITVDLGDTYFSRSSPTGDWHVLTISNATSKEIQVRFPHHK